MDTALTSFNQTNSESDLKFFIDNKIKEGLYLEFKRKSNATNGDLLPDDKKNFSKALSGFANSDGGLLIWGMETRSKDESAQKLRPINEVDKFIRSLKSYLTSATQPVVDGVLIEKISKNGSSTRGYVKCYIPASLKAPHRSAYDREYYKRSIEGFYRLEHFDLEDMFGRRMKPDLRVIVEAKPLLGEDKTLIELTFGLINDGRSVAKYAGLFCRFDDNIEITQVRHPLQDLTRLNNAPCVSYSNNSDVIHPNGITMSAGSLVFRKKDASKVLSGEIAFYCENAEVKNKHMEI